MSPLTQEEFVEKAIAKHGAKYDYSKTTYVKRTDKVIITCRIHGDFIQSPATHLRTGGCPKCGYQKLSEKNTMGLEKFIEKSNLVHNNKFDYSKVKYTSNKTKVNIICPIHGEFRQLAGDHLKGIGCKSCGNQTKKYNIWSYSEWEEAGSKSKNFDGYSFYVIECWNDTEQFLKIGKTFVNVQKRYHHVSLMPYEYKVLFTQYGSAKYISELERSIQVKYESRQVTPCIPFAGISECIDITCKDDILKEFI